MISLRAIKPTKIRISPVRPHQKGFIKRRVRLQFMFRRVIALLTFESPVGILFNLLFPLLSSASLPTFFPRSPRIISFIYLFTVCFTSAQKWSGGVKNDRLAVKPLTTTIFPSRFSSQGFYRNQRAGKRVELGLSELGDRLRNEPVQTAIGESNTIHTQKFSYIHLYLRINNWWGRTEEKLNKYNNTLKLSVVF